GQDAGYDMVNFINNQGAGSCYINSGDTSYGQNGGNGGDANSGTGVAGCSATAGSVTGGHWNGASATNGNYGGNGGGGGGGGAGGGSRCINCTGGKDNL